MGAKLSRKKSEAGIGEETVGPTVKEGSPVADAEQKSSEGDAQEEKTIGEPGSSSSVSAEPYTSCRRNGQCSH